MGHIKPMNSPMASAAEAYKVPNNFTAAKHQRDNVMRMFGR
jgi:hypothetical protein